FEVQVSNYLKNSAPQPVGPFVEARSEVIEGFHLLPLAPNPEVTRNAPGAIVSLRGTHEHRAIAWGFADHPWTVEPPEGRWTVDLRRREWQLPFAIRLEQFIHEYHPGTQIARTYESDVMKIENGEEQRINIRMNEPLRHRGYTFFQSSFLEVPEGSGRF